MIPTPAAVRFSAPAARLQVTDEVVEHFHPGLPSGTPGEPVEFCVASLNAPRFQLAHSIFGDLCRCEHVGGVLPHPLLYVRTRPSRQSVGREVARDRLGGRLRRILRVGRLRLVVTAASASRGAARRPDVARACPASPSVSPPFGPSRPIDARTDAGSMRPSRVTTPAIRKCSTWNAFASCERHLKASVADHRLQVADGAKNSVLLLVGSEPLAIEIRANELQTSSRHRLDVGGEFRRRPPDL